MLVHQESQTFDRKQLAATWARAWELAMREPGALKVAMADGLTVRATISRSTLNDIVWQRWISAMAGPPGACPWT